MGDEQRDTTNNTSQTTGSSSSNGDGNGAGAGAGAGDIPSIQVRLIEHVKANKVDVALWAFRLLTIIFAIGYVLPIFGNSQSNYNKVLLANAATSALRLHQRLPAFSFSREFISRLFLEDSCHYFFFSLIFLSVNPTLPVLMPVILFAILHASSYSLKLLDLLGQNSWWGARFIISIVEFQTTNILRLAAFVEIVLMPMTVIYVFVGRAGLITPFIYYQFLIMRYTSRRNPYTRNMFSELRMTTEALALRSPSIIQKILYGGINFVSRMAPQQQ